MCSLTEPQKVRTKNCLAPRDITPRDNLYEYDRVNTHMIIYEAHSVNMTLHIIVIINRLITGLCYCPPKINFLVTLTRAKK